MNPIIMDPIFEQLFDDASPCPIIKHFRNTPTTSKSKRWSDWKDCDDLMRAAECFEMECRGADDILERLIHGKPFLRELWEQKQAKKGQANHER